MRAYALAHLAICSISLAIASIGATIVYAGDQLIAFVLESAVAPFNRLASWPSISELASPGLALAGPSGERHEAAMPRRAARRNI